MPWDTLPSFYIELIVLEKSKALVVNKIFATSLAVLFCYYYHQLLCQAYPS